MTRGTPAADKTFDVEVKVLVIRKFRVDANDEDEAKRKAEDMAWAKEGVSENRIVNAFTIHSVEVLKQDEGV